MYVLVNSRTSSAYFSTSRDVTSKSSSDLVLDRGRRPKFKSEEFCEVTSLLLLVKIIVCDLCEIAGTGETVLHLMGAGPGPGLRTSPHVSRHVCHLFVSRHDSRFTYDVARRPRGGGPRCVDVSVERA